MSPIEEKSIKCRDLEVTQDEKATKKEEIKPVNDENEVEVNAYQGNGVIKIEMGAENIPKSSFDYAHDHKTEDFAINSSLPNKKARFQPTCKGTFYIIYS